MAYTGKFQRVADTARAQVAAVEPDEVDTSFDAGAIALDIRDPDEHATNARYINGGLNAYNALEAARGFERSN